jgi:hypothetical protein
MQRLSNTLTHDAHLVIYIKGKAAWAHDEVKALSAAALAALALIVMQRLHQQVC